ncbi:hypothetical protein MC885_010681 [Smutsia gigantea]|nr:hypothetical protein MC885_010681 [Smutsia gigantea]
MNDDNSDDKTEDELQPLFISDKNRHTHAYDQKSPQNSPANSGHWLSATPDDMVVDYETNPPVDPGESISLNLQCDEILKHQKSSSDLISKEVLETCKDCPRQPSAHVNTGEPPKFLRNSCHSLESFQSQSVETSLPFVWKSNNDNLHYTDYSSALELNQTFDMKMDNINCPFIKHDAIGESQSLHTTGSLQPTGLRIRNASLSCSIHTSSHSDKINVREISYDRDTFGNPQATTSEAQNTTYSVFSDVVMQADVVPDTGDQCQYFSGKVPSEYADGLQQRLVGEKEIHAPTPVSQGMDVPNGSVLKEFFCLSKDDPNSETHSQSSYGQKEMGHSLRETVSSCLRDDECPLLVPAFDNSKAQVPNPEHDVTVAEDTEIASNGKDLGTPNRTMELLLSSPGQNVASSVDLSWNANDMVISTNDTVCMSTPILEPTNAAFSVSPIEVTERCCAMERGTRELRNSPNLKGIPMNMTKPNLGKPADKPNSPLGSKVRKTEIISYPRPNFKNVKAKVMSRPVLQSKEPAVSKAVARPQLTSASSPSSVSSSRHLTVLNKTPRSDLNADPKPEILINKMQKQQFNKFITSQAVCVPTHSKNALHKVPRTTSAMKSNQEDVDKAGAPNSACETGSEAPFLQKVKDITPVEMESTECSEMMYASSIDRISPEKKGEKENGIPMEKQELKKEIMNETFEYGSLFVGSASKPAAGLGRIVSKPDSSSLRKTPGPKARVGPSVSCLRWNSDSRNLSSDQALSSQRVRRVSSSGKNKIIQLCLIAVGKPTSLKTAQPSWVNLPRPLPKSRALKNSALRRTGSTSPIASTHSDLSTYSTNSGNGAVIKYEEKPPKPAFQNSSSGSLYLKPLGPRAHVHLLKTPPKGMVLTMERRGKTRLLSHWLVGS